MASFSSNVFHELSHITNHDEWRQQATEKFRSSSVYENHLQICDFHGTQPNIDCQTYFDNFPFKFAIGNSIQEAPVVLPPWKKPPKQLRSVLENLGCSTAIMRVPKVECKGAQHLMCLPNAQRMVEMNGGGSVVFGYSIFQGTKHWYMERHAVYKTEDEKLVDPTPSLYPSKIEPYTCFVEAPNFAHNSMQKGYIIWMNKQQMKWMIRNKWYGNEIFMKSPSEPYKVKPSIMKKKTNCKRRVVKEESRKKKIM